ncbi:hypothetical protein HDV00_005557 [Rhizophlyctis rosea]|nr:hypothetical protein HDV00_005557 [Rhizophlyctis rosea]
MEKVLEAHHNMEEVRAGYVDGKFVGMAQAKRDAKAKKVHATCLQCTPKQVEKITCIICRKTKPLDKFSKAQRRMAAKDNGARCLECVKLREDLDWVQNEEPGTIRYEHFLKEDDANDADLDAALDGDNSRPGKKSKEPEVFLPPF